MSFEEQAEQYKARMARAGLQLSERDQLTLYALYKQATVGDAPATAGSLNPARIMMHREWATLRGTSRAEAGETYLEVAAALSSRAP